MDSSRLDDLDEDALLKRDGIGIVYIPLAPNEARVPEFDPFVVSTWRREVTAEESQALLDVAEVGPRIQRAQGVSNATPDRQILPTVARRSLGYCVRYGCARSGNGLWQNGGGTFGVFTAIYGRMRFRDGRKTLIHSIVRRFSHIQTNCVHRSGQVTR